LQFEFSSGQTQGKRTAQEDTVDVLLPSDSADKPAEFANSGTAPSVVVVVADGMGGHVGGRIASNLSSKYFLDAVNKASGSWADRMDQALLQANEILRTATEARPELDGMGSTLVGAILNEHGVGWVSVGDSALYLCRGGELVRLNEDHSFGAYLDDQVRQGIITAEQAAHDRRRNQLFHALLGDPLDHYERFAGFRELKPGDVVLLASDGLKTLTDEQIGKLIADNGSIGTDAIVQKLLDAVEAENRDRQDNTSVIVARARAGDAAPRVAPSERTITVPLPTVLEDKVEVRPEPETEDASSMVREVAERRPARDAVTVPVEAGTAQKAPPMLNWLAVLAGLVIGLAATLWYFRDRFPFLAELKLPF
jgi:serine/threonine protein phosphatase PrpC